MKTNLTFKQIKKTSNYSVVDLFKIYQKMRKKIPFLYEMYKPIEGETLILFKNQTMGTLNILTGEIDICKEIDLKARNELIKTLELY